MKHFLLLSGNKEKVFVKIIVDAFGGDNAPLEVIKGCILARETVGAQIILCGNAGVIEKTARENALSIEGLSFLDVPCVFSPDMPSQEVLSRRDTSLSAGLAHLAGGFADAFVSAGPTGAVVLGASIMTGRRKGIKRSAIGVVIPASRGAFLLLDAGANVDCRPGHLEGFALLGDEYARNVMGIENPRVALANIGTESIKGDSLRREVYELLSASRLNFVGNVEARDIPVGGFDVLVADGFTGNIILKLYEGTAQTLSGDFEKICAAFPECSGAIKKYRQRLDYTALGGAPLLGLDRVVIKAHGSSNAAAIRSAIRQAALCVKYESEAAALQ